MLPDYLIALRHEKGYSQKQEASLLEINVSALKNWEKGRNTPNLRNILKLSLLFSIPPSLLLEVETKEKISIQNLSIRQKAIITDLVELLYNPGTGNKALGPRHLKILINLLSEFYEI